MPATPNPETPTTRAIVGYVVVDHDGIVRGSGSAVVIPYKIEGAAQKMISYHTDGDRIVEMREVTPCVWKRNGPQYSDDTWWFVIPCVAGAYARRITVPTFCEHCGQHVEVSGG